MCVLKLGDLDSTKGRTECYRREQICIRGIATMTAALQDLSVLFHMSFKCKIHSFS